MRGQTGWTDGPNDVNDTLDHDGDALNTLAACATVAL